MPDSNKPTGVDFYIGEGLQDWQTWADKGVQFAFLKERQGDWTYDGAGANPPHWFSKSWQAVKDAGMLRAPYLFPMVAKLNVPSVASVTAGNWQATAIVDVDPTPANAPLPHDDGVRSLDYVLAQTNSFCDEVLSSGWGEPGDLPPAVDVEAVTFFTNAAVAVPFIAGDTPDVWQRLTQAQRQNAIVLIVVVIERRLGVKPFIYCGAGWWEHIDARDNGGAGFIVNHRGVQYQVQNFADYPLWCLARTTGTAGEAIIPATWAFRPAPAESRFIWQFAKDPDLNIVAQITATRPNPAVGQPNSVIATVTELGTDMSYLEGLAKITKPAAARTLQRISPAPISPAPHASFNILLIGQGFNAQEWPAIANRVWTDPQHATSITDSPPFADLARASRVACYADDGTGVWLRIRQVPSKAPNFDDVLSIAPEAAGRLQDYLGMLQIVGADGVTTPANQVWLTQRRLTGSTGSLVVVLRNNRNPAQNPPAPLPAPVPPAQAPGELYQLDPSENYPVPVVVVNVTWNDELWPQVVVRALAQNLGGLGDEYELPGDAFDHPDDNLAVPNPPNLIRLDQATRATLPAAGAGAAVPADLVQTATQDWQVALNAPLDFYASGAAPAALGGTHLVEGGGGFRHNVMRSDFDCLMRRIPSPVATTLSPPPAVAKVRDAIGFCRVCTAWLQSVVRGGHDVRPGASVRLDTQRISYDWVSWKNNAKAAGFAPRTPLNQTLTLNVPASEPKWSMTVKYGGAGATLGDLFQITTVQLAQRPGDPYAKSVDILKTLRFTDLSVAFSPRRGAPVGPAQNLTVAVALANTLDPPKLEIASDGGAARDYQVGAKLTLAWPIMAAGQMLFTVEAVFGLVLSGQGPVDPRTPTIGCRILPQFAMRVRRASRLVDAGGKVTVLKGSAVIDAVNAIAPDATLDARIAAPATGKIGVSLVSESNRAGLDSVMNAVNAASQLTPASGRKLSAVDVTPPVIIPVSATPPLAWSWRYDFVRTLLAASKTVIGAYHSDEAKGKPTPVRSMQVNWPSMSTFNMDVTKLPKQGSYDAIIIHPVDTSATPVVAFPACADLGLVLPLRYGLSGGDGFGNALGWGTGRLDQGSNTTHGAPLVPPNQHVDLIVNPVAAGQVTITYTVSAQNPSPNEWQVFLNQGLLLGYSYGIRFAQMAWLATMADLSGVPKATVLPLWGAMADPLHPETADLVVRALFRSTLHPGARNYDNTRDGSTAQQAPEASSVAGAVETL